MNNKIKHLELIQAIISRMAANSFMLKGWTVFLVSALFALAAKDSNQLFIYLAYFPAVCFWILDGYFLRQERLYRKLYDRIRISQESEIDFSMATQDFEAIVDSWLEVVISKTLLIFHGGVVGTIALVMVIRLFGK